MVVLMVITVGYMPLVLPLLLEGVSVNPASIARSLILLMLIPLAVGLALIALLGRHDVTGAALAAYFAVSVVAAVFLAFPMPIAGAGPSHLIGFGMAIGWLAVADRVASRKVSAG